MAIVFALAYGGTMQLYASFAREALWQGILGTVLGAARLQSSMGMALGPLLGGWLYDRFGTYTWLYIGSMAVGLAAAAIALLFPSARKPSEVGGRGPALQT